MNINDEVLAGQAIIYRSSLSSLLPPQELGSVFALLEVNNYLDTINNRRSISNITAAERLSACSEHSESRLKADNQASFRANQNAR